MTVALGMKAGAAGVLAVAALVTAGAVILGPGELRLPADHSSNYVQVVDDPEWLGYLPPDVEDPDFSLSGMNSQSGELGEVWRVDLVVPSTKESPSLCFGASAEAVEEQCPGSVILGQTDRDVDLPWVGQIGESSTDWLALLGPDAPEISDLAYLDE